MALIKRGNIWHYDEWVRLPNAGNKNFRGTTRLTNKKDAKSWVDEAKQKWIADDVNPQRNKMLVREACKRYWEEHCLPANKNVRIEGGFYRKLYGEIKGTEPMWKDLYIHQIKIL